MKVLPERYLRLMSPADRRSIGQMTSEEALRKAEVKNERDLHKLIRSLLGLRGIAYIESRMDKRTTQTKGVPDFMFAVRYCDEEVGWVQAPCAWEIKFGDGQLSKEQQQMVVRLQSRPNCWTFRVIRSFDEALAELNDMRL